MYITVELLEQNDACEEQIELFKQFIGDTLGIEATNEIIGLAAKFNLDVAWAIKKFNLDFSGTIENSDGSKHWYQNGKYHRFDGPAIEYSNGYKHWYQNGKRHRLDGPAVEYSNGDKYWYQNGELHRLDGPAIEFANGTKYWYINGTKLTEEEFIKHTSIVPCDSTIIEVNGKKYRLIEKNL